MWAKFGIGRGLARTRSTFTYWNKIPGSRRFLLRRAGFYGDETHYKKPYTAKKKPKYKTEDSLVVSFT